MKALRVNGSGSVEVEAAGDYWWIPEYLMDDLANPANWQIVHLREGPVHLYGVIYGPIKPPTWIKVLPK